MKARKYISTMALPAPEGWQIPAADMRELMNVLQRKVAWIVLIAYTLLIIKPALPVIADKMAHTFWKSQHMLTVHEVNGKFHVHNEVAKAASHAEKEKQTKSDQQDQQDCITTTVANVYAPTTNTIEDLKQHTYQSNYSFNYIPSTYQPPRIPLLSNRIMMS